MSQTIGGKNPSSGSSMTGQDNLMEQYISKAQGNTISLSSNLIFKDINIKFLNSIEPADANANILCVNNGFLAVSDIKIGDVATVSSIGWAEGLKSGSSDMNSNFLIKLSNGDLRSSTKKIQDLIDLSTHETLSNRQTFNTIKTTQSTTDGTNLKLCVYDDDNRLLKSTHTIKNIQDGLLSSPAVMSMAKSAMPMSAGNDNYYDKFDWMPHPQIWFNFRGSNTNNIGYMDKGSSIKQPDKVGINDFYRPSNSDSSYTDRTLYDNPPITFVNETSISICFLVNVKRLNGSKVLGLSRNSSGNEWSWEFSYSFHENSIRIKNNSNNTIYFLCSETVEFNKVSLIVIQYDGVNGRFYYYQKSSDNFFNQQFNVNKNDYTNIFSRTYRLLVYDGDANEAWRTDIYDVRVYNELLSSSQIENIFNNTGRIYIGGSDNFYCDTPRLYNEELRAIGYAGASYGIKVAKFTLCKFLKWSVKNPDDVGVRADHHIFHLKKGWYIFEFVNISEPWDEETTIPASYRPDAIEIQRDGVKVFEMFLNFRILDHEKNCVCGRAYYNNIDNDTGEYRLMYLVYHTLGTHYACQFLFRLFHFTEFNHHVTPNHPGGGIGG